MSTSTSFLSLSYSFTRIHNVLKDLAGFAAKRGSKPTGVIRQQLIHHRGLTQSERPKVVDPVLSIVSWLANHRTGTEVPAKIIQMIKERLKRMRQHYLGGWFIVAVAIMLVHSARRESSIIMMNTARKWFSKSKTGLKPKPILPSGLGT